ncbi:MAG: hypothetical protein IJ766_06330 [Clostridia bacterium]|nr:hypothetical protein [Clostridia bacterium]
MNKTTMLKSIGAVAAVGGAAMTIGSMFTGKNAVKRKIKKTANKAVKTANMMLDGMQGMFG